MTGKERIDCVISLGSSLAAFGSLIRGISTCVEMYFHNCIVPLKLHSKILHTISRTLSYLLVWFFRFLFVCLFVCSFFDICQLLWFSRQNIWKTLWTSLLCVMKVQWNSSAATQPLFPLKSDTEKKKHKPSLSWCTWVLKVMVWWFGSYISSSLFSRMWSLVIANTTCVWALVLNFYTAPSPEFGNCTNHCWICQKIGGGRGTPIHLCNNKYKVGAWGTERRTNKAGNSLSGLMTDETEPQCKLFMTSTPTLMCLWVACAWHLRNSWEGMGVSWSESSILGATAQAVLWYLQRQNCSFGGNESQAGGECDSCWVCWKQTSKPGTWASLQTDRTYYVPGKCLWSIDLEKRVDNRSTKCSTFLF